MKNKRIYPPMNWDSFAEKHQKALKVVQYTKDRGCPVCRYKPTTWADFEFHFQSTHGVPREILILYMV